MMPHMNKTILLFVPCLLIACSVWCSAPVILYGQEHHGAAAASSASATEKTPVYAPMPGPGKKVPIGGGYYLIYGFEKKPVMGTNIMRLEIYTAEGKKDTGFEAKADADMPSMRGAHGTGDKAFVVSKKGDYLLPIPIVMPGDWEVRLIILKEGKVIFRGRYNFDV
jgi:hypothetical protein